MAPKRNLLTVLGCSGSLALTLSMTPSALANPVESTSIDDHTLPSFTQSEDNPIKDALSCSCARCTMGQQANL